MQVQMEVGSILEGTVSGITKFGAFVSLPGGKSGLVHISEIANTYVNDVSEYLSEGGAVKVKVIGISDDGKINLSIKKAVETPRGESRGDSRPGGRPAPRQAPRQNNFSYNKAVAAPSADVSFEDKLKQFMQDSDSKNYGNRLYGDKKGQSRKRR